MTIASSTQTQVAEAAKPSTIEWVETGNTRKVRALHDNFNSAHQLAWKYFTRELKEDLMSGNYVMSNFQTDIGREKGQFYIAYQVDLNAPDTTEDRQTVVIMRGTVLSSNKFEDAKEQVEEANQEKTGKRFQDNLSATYNRHWKPEKANDTLYVHGTNWYHEAILYKADRPKE